MTDHELDCEVAEKVMGWKVVRIPEPRGEDDDRPAVTVEPTEPIDLWSRHYGWTGLPQFSTSIKDAWLVVEWLRANYDTVAIYFDSREGTWELDCCEHIDYETGKRDDGSDPRLGCAIASDASAARAICLTAIQAAERARREGRRTLSVRERSSGGGE